MSKWCSFCFLYRLTEVMGMAGNGCWRMTNEAGDSRGLIHVESSDPNKSSLTAVDKTCSI